MMHNLQLVLINVLIRSIFER